MVQNGILVLFDIDGTLVRGARCHYQAFVQAVDKFYQMREDISGINYAGKTDPQILREVLTMGGVEEKAIQRDFQACLQYMIDYYQKHVHQENIQVLGGVNELLSQLQSKEVLLGLTTGNLEPIAHAKLGRVGLDDYFPFGGFGSDSEERRGLVKKALERAHDLHHYHGDRIFVVGDTPRDVDAAKPFQIHTLAVATGRYSSQELDQTGADYVLEDLKDLDRILEIIMPD
ncbi:MAG TPA: HAD family hydrolase [Methanobacteriaceae archaeon]|jgi:phosphoglycolate phosphatase|nr:HAD family hydrolase [Euryarchaeota archaeon]HNR26402.1 HAD family hydrolase [Methanobacteriaceae archaeon]HNS25084.1 HAD family hydrolase [Methanobacteriaceae archaeon]